MAIFSSSPNRWGLGEGLTASAQYLDRWIGGREAKRDQQQQLGLFLMGIEREDQRNKILDAREQADRIERKAQFDETKRQWELTNTQTEKYNRYLREEQEATRRFQEAETIASMLAPGAPVGESIQESFADTPFSSLLNKRPPGPWRREVSSTPFQEDVEYLGTFDQRQALSEQAAAQSDRDRQYALQSGALNIDKQSLQAQLDANRRQDQADLTTAQLQQREFDYRVIQSQIDALTVPEKEDYFHTRFDIDVNGNRIGQISEFNPNYQTGKWIKNDGTVLDRRPLGALTNNEYEALPDDLKTPGGGGDGVPEMKSGQIAYTEDLKAYEDKRDELYATLGNEPSHFPSDWEGTRDRFLGGDVTPDVALGDPDFDWESYAPPSGAPIGVAVDTPIDTPEAAVYSPDFQFPDVQGISQVEPGPDLGGQSLDPVTAATLNSLRGELPRALGSQNQLPLSGYLPEPTTTASIGGYTSPDVQPWMRSSGDVPTAIPRNIPLNTDQNQLPPALRNAIASHLQGGPRNVSSPEQEQVEMAELERQRMALLANDPMGAAPAIVDQLQQPPVVEPVPEQLLQDFGLNEADLSGRQLPSSPPTDPRFFMEPTPVDMTPSPVPFPQQPPPPVLEQGAPFSPVTTPTGPPPPPPPVAAMPSPPMGVDALNMQGQALGVAGGLDVSIQDIMNLLPGIPPDLLTAAQEGNPDALGLLYHYADALPPDGQDLIARFIASTGVTPV